MKMYGEIFTFEQDIDLWNLILSYMDGEIKDKLMLELMPCNKEEFLNKYIEIDNYFEFLLWLKFRIEL